MNNDLDLFILISITLFAASVNGALGHGFSSLTVPVALVFYTNRILNPALVLIEIVINSFILIVNRRGVIKVGKRVLPILIGLLPGILLGSYILTSVNPGWVKLLTFVVLIPLILLQAAGVRRPIDSEKSVGLPFGAGVGFLYSITTISGPPLALMFNNQGLVKEEFRAALGIIRVTEALITACAYYFLGLYSTESHAILLTIAPSVLVGLPLGAFLIRRINPETFRRLCMSFDAWVVGFGMSRVLLELGLASALTSNMLWLAVVVIDAFLLYFYFSSKRPLWVETERSNSP